MAPTARLPVSALRDREVQILDAASRAFMQQGFSATSINRISAEIESTKGTIYYYFRSKSDLFLAVHRRAMDLTRSAIQPPFEQDAPARDRLYSMAHAHTMLIMDQLPYLRVAAQGLEMHLLERTNANERKELAEVVTLREKNETLYINVIKDGIKSGEFRKLNPRLISKPILGALNWTSRWYHPRARETSAARSAIAEEIADFVTAGLSRN